MFRLIPSRLMVAAVTFLVAVGAYLAAPPAPRAASADCGPNSGNLCWKNESCAGILWFKQCTTEYKYYDMVEVE